MSGRKKKNWPEHANTQPMNKNENHVSSIIIRKRNIENDDFVTEKIRTRRATRIGHIPENRTIRKCFGQIWIKYGKKDRTCRTAPMNRIAKAHFP